MIFTDEDGVNVIQFGTGDIGVTSGMIDDPSETIGCVSLTQKDEAPIGEDWVHSDECVLDTSIGVHTRLVFPVVESIVVLISQLEKCKNAMLNEINQKED